ncbi:MAG: CDF family Co(II)/Ni(II) efflux transporter DmeF [Burkholderiaceae bacterium]|nr:CDF family Co(II)/Ni(II) efflux transporter DmeF [Burkholderiaceae bacterium]
MNAHTHDLSPWQHSHVFDSGNRRGEARTRAVLAVTLITMVAEIVGGWWTGSMALLADGWHMGTHSLALGVAAAAYALARRHARDGRYAFGTWKIEVLGGFASALVLALVAAGITLESALRLWRAEPIEAVTALWVAVIGLAVNLVSAWLLHGADDGHDHDHGRSHAEAHAHGPSRSDTHHAHAAGHDHDRAHHDDHDHAPAPGHPHRAAAASEGGHDLNLRAAYMHVLADALTSVLAIAALSGALWLGWWWLDPLVGVLGAVVIGLWSIGLMRQTAAVLLDREMDHPLTAQIRTAIESDGDARVADLHLWRVGRQHYAAIASIVADAPLAPADYRARLAGYTALAHLSLEVNRCPRAAECAVADGPDSLTTLPLVRRP